MIWKINTLLALALATTISVPVIEAAQAADSTETAEVSAESFVEIARVFPKSSKSGLVPLEKVLARIGERMEGHSHVVLVLGAKPTEATHFQFSEFEDPWVIYLTEPLNTFTAREKAIEMYANQMEEGNFIVGDFNSLPFLREISAKLGSCFDLIVTDAEVGKFMSFTDEHFSYFLNIAHSTPKCIKRDEIAPGEGTMILRLNQKIEGIMHAKRLPTPDTRQKMPDLRI